MLFQDLTGKRFGSLLVLCRDRKQAGQWKWLCRCDCGRQKVIFGSRLRDIAGTKSCGCQMRRSESSEQTLESHGYSAKPEYRAWESMMQRCYDQNSNRYQYYGGRGIKVCKFWHSFTRFLADMGDKPSNFHSLDRIDNESDYTPENCRWATKKQQARNTRRNRVLSYLGESLSAAEWSERLGISYRMILARKDRGWSDEKVLSTPHGGIGGNDLRRALKPEQLTMIRYRYRSGGITMKKLANEYGVSATVIYKAIHQSETLK